MFAWIPKDKNVNNHWIHDLNVMVPEDFELELCKVKIIFCSPDHFVCCFKSLTFYFLFSNHWFHQQANFSRNFFLAPHQCFLN